ncbi:VanZ family protein [Terasakiella sp.]|uniref:VanZ family protein n=1 Tax=Terasakiella sp. TaxID=2034861 RepID=UPI003AA941E0
MILSFCEKPFALARLLLPIAIMLCAQNGARAWLYLSQHIDGKWIIGAVSLFIFCGIVFWAYKLGLTFHRFFSVQMILVVGGLALLFWLPDERFIVKKIHVPEYIAIALASCWALRPCLSSAFGLLSASLAFAIFLGLHDEVIQGFHPERYFGYLDIIVNGGSAFIGVWLGRYLFEGRVPDKTDQEVRILFGAFLCSLIFIILFIYLCWSYKGELLPVWVALPALFACCPYFFLCPRKKVSADAFFVRNTLIAMTSLLSVYILIGYFISLKFD